MLDLPLYFRGCPSIGRMLDRRCHVALPVEIGRRLDLQLGSLDVPIQMTAAFQLQQVLHLDSAGHLSHNIRLLAIDIALHYTTRTDHDLRRTMDITDQRSVDPQ